MNLRNRRLVLSALALWTVTATAGGGAYMYLHRNDTICSDRKAPVAQQDQGLGQISYRCHNGQIVKK